MAAAASEDLNGRVEGDLNRLLFLSGAARAAAVAQLSAFAASDVFQEKANGAVTDRTAGAIITALDDAVAVADTALAACCCALLSAAAMGTTPRAVDTARGAAAVALVLKQASAATAAADADAAFQGMDLAATLASNSGEARAALGDAGCCALVVAAAKQHRKDGRVLFGAGATIATLTMADVANGGRVVAAGGVQFLADVFKVTTRQQHAAAKQGSGGGGDAAEEAAALRADACRYARQALLNLCKVPAAAADAAFAACQWGRYGDLLEADELKWDVEAERKRCAALLKAFRDRQRAAAAAAAAQ
jgi:hypothetical protein